MLHPDIRAFAVALALPLAPVIAQACGSGDLLLKNDILPAVPGGATAVGVVPGLCEGEAAMAVLTTPGACFVRKVSVMFGNFPLGTNGNIAAVDIEIYDGATMAATGVYTLGPMVWSLSGNTGNNLQIQTHALNEFSIPGNVRVNSGKLVVGWRMLLNGGSGSCQTGYFDNFCVDNSGQCIAGRNIIDALPPIGQKVDPVTYHFPPLGTPLCGTIYWSGDWIIRACITPDVSVTWAGNPTPGGAVVLTLLAPNHANEFYVTMLSLGTAPGLNTPFGHLPLNNDFLLTCSLNPGCWPQLLVNSNGNLNVN
ncbi:MAG TPA: hypothetical protein VK348_05900, partial [Planctomycetota bacterium]|nr:hypothetical protein [Planctomycetota bacterium]